MNKPPMNMTGNMTMNGTMNGTMNSTTEPEPEVKMVDKPFYKWTQ